MRKIRIAQIGLNQYSHSLSILHMLVTHADVFDLVGIALPEHEKTRLPAQYAAIKAYNLPELSVQEILDDKTIEAVTVETDEVYLTEYALLAAKAGKHVHMEKPGGADVDTFKQLVDTVKQTGKVFHTGYMYRYNPYIRDLMQRIRAGELGEIINVEAQMNCFHPKETRQWLQQFPGGMMFYLGCHLVDIILQIMGMPQKVLALNTCTGIDVTDAQDFGMAVLTYQRGVSFAKASGYELGGCERRQIVVVGTKGTIELKPIEFFPPTTEKGTHYTERTTYTSADWTIKGVKEQSEPFCRYGEMMRAFAAYVRGETENPYTPDYEWKLYTTILACCGVHTE